MQNLYVLKETRSRICERAIVEVFGHDLGSSQTVPYTMFTFTNLFQPHFLLGGGGVGVGVKYVSRGTVNSKEGKS
jgi:hypothetical protein